MGLLEPYVGKYVTATSASTKLDAQAVIEGCDAVDAEAANILKYSNEISSNASKIDAEALSVDGVTIQEPVSKYCEYISSIKSNIETSTNNIRSAVELQYNKIQEEFNEIARQQDAQAEKKG